MESNHLTTRTYTAPTCTLIVSSKEVQPTRTQAQQPSPVDFILELERSDLGEIDRVTLQGQPSQLDRLQQTVNRYIAALVAKFPHPIAQIEDRAPGESTDGEPPTEIVPQPLRDPRNDNESSPRAGIIKNLPGLRDSLPLTPPNSPPGFEEKPSISRLLGRWQKPQSRDPQSGSTPLNSAAGATPADAPVTTQPYLTGVGERSLEHQLHLGNLATPVSGSVLTLSAIQLFDLAAVLDEYTDEHVTTNDRPNVLNRNSIYNRGERASDGGVPVVPGVPNLPGMPAQQSERPAFYPIRVPRKSSSFMSGLPWAIAAAAAVGLPLLLLDPNANPVKDLATQLKIPSLTSTKKTTTTTKTTKDTATKTDSTAPIAGATPTPWQAQPVEPPKTTVTTDPTKVAIADPTKVTTTPDTSKIGIAAIPDAILSPGGTVSPTIDGTGTTATTATKPIATNKPTPTAKTPTKPVVAATTKTAKTAKPATTTIGQLPIDTDTSGKVSISTQPISVPPAFSSPTTKPATPIPFDRAGIDASGKIDPVNRSLAPKKTATKTTPAPVLTQPKPQATKPNPAGSPNSSDPFTPVSKNPNLIDQNSPETTPTPQPAATVPTQPLPSNAGSFSGDVAENSSLQETKRYFQGKWKASTNQVNALQYVLQVNGKSGVVRAVAPQGEAATTYLQQTKFIKPGQKLLPAAAGGGEQKIRVLLQPDGSVDTFIEP